ncbi:MAG: hypothetical protein V4812_18205 [Pseudomonadota bacterium]
MKTLKNLFTAVIFSLAGAAVHANAASENHRCESGICFQLTPLAGKGASGLLAEDGSSRTPQGLQGDAPILAGDGSSRTPQGLQNAASMLAEEGFSRTPLGQQVQAAWVAENGFSRTPLGRREPMQA